MRTRFGVLKGFTLVELLVVMSIMAILMTIVIIGTQTVRLRGRDAKRKTDLSKVQSSLAIFYADKKSYPIPYSGSPLPGFGELQIYNGSIAGYPNLMAALKTKQYIDTIPQDPKNTANYKFRYHPAPSGLGFELSAKLENTHDGELTSDNTGTTGADNTRYEIGSDKTLSTKDGGNPTDPNDCIIVGWTYTFAAVTLNLRTQ